MKFDTYKNKTRTYRFMIFEKIKDEKIIGQRNAFRKKKKYLTEYPKDLYIIKMKETTYDKKEGGSK